MLGGGAAVEQAPVFDGLVCDSFPFLQDDLATPEVDVRGREIAEALVVAAMGVVLGEGADLRLEVVRCLEKLDATFTVTWRLLGVRREGNELRAEVGSDYGDVTRERRVDQVVVNHGTRPLDDIYFELKPKSTNLGEIDHEALVAGRPQAVTANPEGAFQLFRIGDAVVSRNTHAAIYDALRLVKDL